MKLKFGSVPADISCILKGFKRQVDLFNPNVLMEGSAFKVYVCIFASQERGGGGWMRSVSRLASHITSVCFPAGLEAGWEPNNGDQRHG